MLLPLQRSLEFAHVIQSRTGSLYYGAGPTSPTNCLSTSHACLPASLSKHLEALPKLETLLSQLPAWPVPQTPPLSSVTSLGLALLPQIANQPHQEQLLRISLLCGFFQTTYHSLT